VGDKIFIDQGSIGSVMDLKKIKNWKGHDKDHKE
jgi:hypothetical protein